ncbi:hypothetical protein SAZ10_33135, partial [Mesorhizobium sp. BAC0120]|uniref:hypothetical protein n=1 Tax=Mesorhizobium sp. BAC0120 TaxID=3090670 RepID=UPI00298CD85F
TESQIHFARNPQPKTYFPAKSAASTAPNSHCKSATWQFFTADCLLRQRSAVKPLHLSRRKRHRN